jgi:uncharacterized protein
MHPSVRLGGRAASRRIGDDRGMRFPTTTEPPAAPRVVAMSTTAVKGLALEAPQSMLVGRARVATDRAFFLVDANGVMINGKALGELVRVRADVADDLSELTLRFPDATEVRGPVVLGTPRMVQFFRARFAAPSVLGPWADALSEFCGRPIELCRAPAERPGVDRGLRGAVSLVSAGALEALRQAGSVPEPIDPRRFRMLFLIDGVAPHAEDHWCGRTVGIGGARLRINGLVGRCAVTTRDPDSGRVDLPTLHYLNLYRGDIRADERLPFGVYAEVVTPGTVRVGDPIEPPDAGSERLAGG